MILVSDGHRYRFRGSRQAFDFCDCEHWVRAGRTLESLEAFAAGGYRELPQARPLKSGCPAAREHCVRLRGEESPKSEAATGAIAALDQSVWSDSWQRVLVCLPEGADMFGGPDVVALSGHCAVSWKRGLRSASLGGNFDSVVRVPAVTVSGP